MDTNAFKELKLARTYEEQLQILKSRELFINDDVTAIQHLSSLNYYRLRGYYIHLQDPNTNIFKSGTSFDEIVAIHSFDCSLRLLLLKLLFDVEIVARTRIAYAIGQCLGTYRL